MSEITVVFYINGIRKLSFGRVCILHFILEKEEGNRRQDWDEAGLRKRRRERDRKETGSERGKTYGFVSF